MSYINDALQKARDGKNTQYENYSDIIAPPAGIKKAHPKSKWFMGLMALILLLTSSGVALYYYQHYNRAQVPMQAPMPQRQAAHPPAPVPLPDQPSVHAPQRVRPPLPPPSGSSLKEETLTPVLLPQRQSAKQDVHPSMPLPGKSPAQADKLTQVPLPQQKTAMQERHPAVPLPAKSLSKEQTLHAEAARFYREALTLQRKGRFAEAESLYEKTLSLDPKHALALNNIGVVYMSQNRNGLAVKAFRRAIFYKKDYADPYYNLACLQAKWQNIDPAMRHLKTAISINREIADWARQDQDLNNLHASPEFRSLIEKRGNE
jgi:tetratricopeptide (TPR) repeat protein